MYTAFVPRLTRLLTLALTLSGGLLLARAPASARDAGIDPHAALILHRMAKAYAGLSTFEEVSTFTSITTDLDGKPLTSSVSPTPAPPDPMPGDPTDIVHSTRGVSTGAPLPPEHHITLKFASPNRLAMELSETAGPDSPPDVTKWICDGKLFYTCVMDKATYSAEKAPASIRNFLDLKYLDGGNMELVMLMGIDPFADLADSVSTASVEPDAAVSGVTTEVVTLRTNERYVHTTMRLYVGKTDSMLYKLEIETVPVVAPPPGPIKTGSKLDDLIDTPRPAPQQPQDTDPAFPALAVPVEAPQEQKHVRSMTVFTNTVAAEGHIDSEAFKFVPPANAVRVDETGAKLKRSAVLQQVIDAARKLHHTKNHPKTIHL